MDEIFLNSLLVTALRLRLDWDENFCVCVYGFFFFFFSRVFERFEGCGYCSCTVQWTVAANFDFSNIFGPITTYRVLFTDPQISLFNNFFIKNESYDTIYTFKNYFATVFFSFQFQFSVFRCIQTDPKKREWEKEKEKDWGEMGNGEGGWMKKRRVGLFYV